MVKSLLSFIYGVCRRVKMNDQFLILKTFARYFDLTDYLSAKLDFYQYIPL